MLNKKILAAAIAATLSTGANAAVDLNANTGTVVIASESINASNLNNTDNMVELTAAGTELDLVFNAGFSIANGTSKYVRVDLTNAKFSSFTSLDDVGAPGNTAVTVASAGGVGQSFIIIEMAADVDDITASEDLTLSATYRAMNNSTVGVSYKLFETAQQAIDNTATGLASASGSLVTIRSALTGSFSDASTAQAKVASLFRNFDGVALPGDTDETLTAIDIADLFGTAPTAPSNLAGFRTPATDTTFNAGSLNTASAKIKFTGDFGFGTFTYGANDWSLDSDGEYVVTNAVENNDGSFTVDYAAASLVVDTIDTDGVQDVANKGSYQAELSGVAVTGVADPVNAIPTFTEAAGTITYDTTSIEVPYVTTFSEYNQRLYIVNTGSQDASYTVSFTSEDAVTSATPGTAAEGVVPGNSVLMIKATDLVTLEGRDRTSAVIEVEATDANVSASTQIVNLENGNTDTIVLN